MAEMILRPDLVEKIQEIARIENRPADAVVESLLAQYRPQTNGTKTAPEEDDYETQYRAFRRKLYTIARCYWTEVDDQTRLALTDEALDEQFWLIDQDGIPRLKSEEGTIDLPPDSFDAIIGIFDDDITDLSTTVRETMNTYYAGKYDRPD